MDEAARIKDVYARRDASGKRRLYTDFNESSLYIHQKRDASILRLLRKNGLEDLSGSKIIEVGCGNGSVLRRFMSWGADPAKCSGIDLLPERIKEAVRLSPNMSFSCGNAERLPYADGAFDVVIVFTVFSSILDDGMKAGLAREVMRILGKGGAVVYYDYHVSDPRNRDVKGIKRDEIQRLFPGCLLDLRRETLAPPIVRALIPFSRIACDILEKVFLLKTHYIGVIRKR